MPLILQNHMKWQIKDESDKRIYTKSNWLPISNCDTFEERAGVYVFADSDFDVGYIGKAGAGRMVDEINNAIYREKDNGCEKVKALYTNSDVNAKSLEGELIQEYNPKNNIIGK